MNAIETLFLFLFFFASLVVGHLLQKLYGTGGFIGGFFLGFIACLAMYCFVHWIIGLWTKIK